MENVTQNEKKISLNVMIEGARTYTETFGLKQKLQVVINKVLEKFGLTDGEKRLFTRGDGSQLTDFKITVEEAGLRDTETLRFMLKSAPKPDEPKKFA